MRQEAGALRIVINRDQEEPVYEQIARQIRGFIATGQLAPGALVPPVRVLASDLGVNLNTVARAYRALEEGGFLAIRDRSGARVTAPADRPEEGHARTLREDLREVLVRMRQAGISPKEMRRLASLEIGWMGGRNRRKEGV